MVRMMETPRQWCYANLLRYVYLQAVFAELTFRGETLPSGRRGTYHPRRQPLRLGSLPRSSP